MSTVIQIGYAPTNGVSPRGGQVVSPTTPLPVEKNYTPSGKLVEDTLVKTGVGFVHTVTFTCNDAAPTAGSIIIYNSLTETGVEIFNHTFTTTPFVPFTVTLDVNCSIGIYVGFTTTADVNVFVSYR